MAGTLRSVTSPLILLAVIGCFAVGHGSIAKPSNDSGPMEITLRMFQDFSEEKSETSKAESRIRLSSTNWRINPRVTLTPGIGNLQPPILVPNGLGINYGGSFGFGGGLKTSDGKGVDVNLFVTQMLVCSRFRDNMVTVFGYLLNMPKNPLPRFLYASLYLIQEELVSKRIHVFDIMSKLKSLSYVAPEEQFLIIFTELQRVLPKYLVGTTMVWLDELKLKTLPINDWVRPNGGALIVDFLSGIDSTIYDSLANPLEFKPTSMQSPHPLILEQMGKTFAYMFNSIFDGSVVITPQLFAVILLHLPGEVLPHKEETLVHLVDQLRGNIVQEFKLTLTANDKKDHITFVRAVLTYIANTPGEIPDIRQSANYLLPYIKTPTSTYANPHYGDLYPIVSKPAINVPLLLKSVQGPEYPIDIIDMGKRIIQYIKLSYFNVEEISLTFTRHKYNKPIDILIAFLTKAQFVNPTLDEEIMAHIKGLQMYLIFRKIHCNLVSQLPEDFINYPSLIEDLNSPVVPSRIREIGKTLEEFLNKEKVDLNSIAKKTSLEECSRPRQCIITLVNKAIDLGIIKNQARVNDVKILAKELGPDGNPRDQPSYSGNAIAPGIYDGSAVKPGSFPGGDAKGPGSLPNGQAISPFTPGGSAVNPNTPGGSAINPNTPGGSGGNPNTPGGTGVNPNTPGGSGFYPNTPGGSAVNPNTPGGSGVNPNIPGGSGGNPNTPGGSGVNPNTPGGSGVNPNTPGGTAGNPNTPGGSGVNPNTPGGSGFYPNTPGGSAVNPNTPAGSGVNPNKPGGTAGSPNTPGGSGVNPNTPGSSGFYPNTPGGSAVNPNTPGGNAEKPKTIFDSSIFAPALKEFISKIPGVSAVGPNTPSGVGSKPSNPNGPTGSNSPDGSGPGGLPSPLAPFDQSKAPQKFDSYPSTYKWKNPSGVGFIPNLPIGSTGYQPYQPNGGTGYQPNQHNGGTGYQPYQPNGSTGYQPNQPIGGTGYQPNQPNGGNGNQPNQPNGGTGYQPNQPIGGTGNQPNQPIGGTGNQPNGGTGYQPNQPIGGTGYQPNQPIGGTGNQPNQPNGKPNTVNGFQPNLPNLPNTQISTGGPGSQPSQPNVSGQTGNTQKGTNQDKETVNKDMKDFINNPFPENDDTVNLQPNIDLPGSLIPKTEPHSPQDELIKPIRMFLIQDNLFKLLGPKFNPSEHKTRLALLIAILEEALKLSTTIVSNELKIIMEKYLLYLTKYRDSTSSGSMSVIWMSTINALEPPANPEEAKKYKAIVDFLSKPDLPTILGKDFNPAKYQTNGQLLKSLFEYLMNAKAKVDTGLIECIKTYSKKVSMNGFGAQGIQFGMTYYHYSTYQYSTSVLEKTVDMNAILLAIPKRTECQTEMTNVRKFFATEFSAEKHMRGFDFTTYQTKGAWLQAFFTFLYNNSFVNPLVKKDIATLLNFIVFTGPGAEKVEYV